MVTIDAEFEMPVYSPICTFCKHLQLDKERGCAAFAEIAVEIWLGKNDHRESFTGDNGIRFESVKDA